MNPEPPLAEITRKAAAEAGLRYFFTGRSCKRGHTARRYVSTGQCSECMKAAARSASTEIRRLRQVERMPSSEHWIIVKCGTPGEKATMAATCTAMGLDYYDPALRGLASQQGPMNIMPGVPLTPRGPLKPSVPTVLPNGDEVWAPGTWHDMEGNAWLPRTPA